MQIVLKVWSLTFFIQKVPLSLGLFGQIATENVNGNSLIKECTVATLRDITQP